MANNLSLSNVINVTLVPSTSGLSEFNTSNLLLYSTDNPIVQFDEDYRIYRNASSVAEDFGVNSLTYKMALAVFSQTPNILSNSGALIIGLKQNGESQVEAFYRLKSKVLFCGWMTTDTIANDVNANKKSFFIPASIEATVAIDNDFVDTVKALVSPSISVVLNEESSSANDSISLDFSEAETKEDIAMVIEEGLKQHFGMEGWRCSFGEGDKFIIACFNGLVNSFVVADNDLTTALKIDAAEDPTSTTMSSFDGITDAIQAENNKINFVVSNVQSDIDTFKEEITDRGNKKTRCLFYGGDDNEAKIMMAAYASRAMSTIFEASLTTQTMHLKPLTSVSPDPIMTETLLQKCKDAGVDSYISIEGVACVFSTGKNGFFDEVFNELWFVNAIQVAGFNYLRQTNTKIPQTERGMDGLKNAYAQVCVRGINNGFLAAGSWTSPDTFGNPDTFKRNIESSGYYVYSTPIAQQNKSDREERKAPLVQIAIKTAGAIHSTNVMIYVNL